MTVKNRGAHQSGSRTPRGSGAEERTSTKEKIHSNKIEKVYPKRMKPPPHDSHLIQTDKISVLQSFFKNADLASRPQRIIVLLRVISGGNDCRPEMLPTALLCSNRSLARLISIHPPLKTRLWFNCDTRSHCVPISLLKQNPN